MLRVTYHLLPESPEEPMISVHKKPKCSNHGDDSTHPSCGEVVTKSGICTHLQQ